MILFPHPPPRALSVSLAAAVDLPLSLCLLVPAFFLIARPTSPFAPLCAGIMPPSPWGLRVDKDVYDWEANGLRSLEDCARRVGWGSVMQRVAGIVGGWVAGVGA